MTTNSTWTLLCPDGTSIQLAPRSTIDQPVSGAFELTLLEPLDLGSPGRENYTAPLAHTDGDFVRGNYYGTRAITLQLGIRVLQAAVAAGGMEGLRDDVVDYVSGLLAQNGVYTLTRARKTYDNNDVERQILGQPTAGPPWLWSPRSLAPGLVGQYSGDHAIIPIALLCHQPFFRSVDPVEDLANTLDGTARSDTFTNSGHRRCGVRMVISGASGTGTISVSNTTGGASETDVGAGLVISDVNLASGSVTIDWFASDASVRSAVQGSTSILDKVSTGGGLWLQKGANTLEWQVTSGSLTSATISFYFYEIWSTP